MPSLSPINWPPKLISTPKSFDYVIDPSDPKLMFEFEIGQAVDYEEFLYSLEIETKSLGSMVIAYDSHG